METTKPDFARLRHFWTLRSVVVAGNFRDAAAKNQVSVSAISQTVSGLERKLGRKLFVKKNRALAPTRHCLELLAQVEPAFQAVQAFSSYRASPEPIPAMTWLDLGVSHGFAADLLPRLTRQLTTKLPKMRLKLKVGSCTELVGLVKKGELCMALVANGGDHRGLSRYPVFEDRLGLFVSARRSVSEGEADAEKGIAALAREGTSGHPAYYARFLRAIAAKYPTRVSCDDYDALYEIAASGALPAILPTRLASRQPGVLREVTAKTGTLGTIHAELVSQATCDPREDSFLVSEIRSLL